jgi:hypothetical protein
MKYELGDERQQNRRPGDIQICGYLFLCRLISIDTDYWKWLENKKE